MTIKEKIIEFLGKRLRFTANLMELYRMRINHSSLRSQLSRMVKDGSLRRIDQGVYQFIKLYRMFRHTKRIFDTHVKKPIRKFDLDVESTSEGFVPANLSIQELESVVNPHLEDETMNILSENGIYIPQERIDFQVIGSEWLEATRSTYKKTHDVELVLINNVGKRYKFEGYFRVMENEYN